MQHTPTNFDIKVQDGSLVPGFGPTFNICLISLDKKTYKSIKIVKVSLRMFIGRGYFDIEKLVKLTENL